MTIFVSLIGLGVIVFIHELGHFVASVALKMRPRKFYVGFPPALFKTTRGGIEYGIGVIPLGGFVKIPGMHRPGSVEVDTAFGRAVEEAPAFAGPVERLRRTLRAGDLATAQTTLGEIDALVADHELSAPALRAAERGVEDIGDGLGADAYWRAKTWKRVLVIFAGPAANIVLALALFTGLFMTSGGKATTIVDAVTENSPAAAIGLMKGDRIVSINGIPMEPSTISPTIQSSNGETLTVRVARAGRIVALLPGKAKLAENDTAYRLGFLQRREGLSAPAAVKESFDITGRVSADIVSSLAHLVTGEGRKDISSPVGIVQGSSDAAKEGTGSFVWVLGLISLSIALLNLLPLLPLDGGHIIFSVIEGVRRRAVRREIYERVSIVGIGLVLLLFFIGLSNDIGRLS